MSAGDVQLAEFIERLQRLGREAQTLAATESAPLVEAAAKATAAAGTDPYGRQWQSKKDGSPALVDAASSVTAVALGTLVRIRTRGGYAIQNFIKVHRRQVIPDKGLPIPKEIVDALKEGSSRAFEKLVG